MAGKNTAKIGSLWIGGELSWIERASLHSFVKTGHDYVLYAYDDVPNIPHGIELRDARDVWNTDKIIYHSKAKSPAIHADIFRALMVQRTGRIWADTDIIALRPFPDHLEWYIGYERTDRLELGNAIMGMPADSKTLRDLVVFLTDDFPIPPWFNKKARDRLEARKEAGESLSLGNLAWGETGPKALTYFSNKSNEIDYAQPQQKFFPVTFQQRKHLTNPDNKSDVEALLKEEESYCIHLYSRWLRKFTKGMTGQLPNRESWLGNYLASEGLVEYKNSKENNTAKTEQKPPHMPLPKTDRDSFYADLEKRRAKLPGGPNISSHGRITAVTMAKDEGPYILEWVAHHHLLGFTDILVHTNDCTDGTAEMFDALHSIGLVNHYDNPKLKTKPPQARALQRSGKHPLVEDADWVMVFDLDEFIAIRHADGKIDNLIDIIKEKNASGMALTWRFFGSSGYRIFENLPVTKRFQQAANNNFTRGFGVKTLFKPNKQIRLGIHRPHMKNKSPENEDVHLNWLNGSGNPIDGKVMTWRQTRKSAGYTFAQVNHYGIKSREEFLMRRLRGDVLNKDGKYDSEYFHRYDQNKLHDDIGLRFAKERDALIQQLRQIPCIRKAEKYIQEQYSQKLNLLRNSEEYEELMQELSATNNS